MKTFRGVPRSAHATRYDSRMNPVASIIAGVAGLAIGAALIHTIVEDGKQQKAAEQAERAYRAASGWTMAEVAAQLIGDFDQDHDGRLAYQAADGAAALGEARRVVDTQRSTEPLLLLGIPTGAKLIRATTTIGSIESLLRKADADHDGVTTAAEVARLLRTYDADKNGRLSNAERAKALADLGPVIVDTQTRTVGVVRRRRPDNGPVYSSSQGPARTTDTGPDYGPTR